MNEPSKSVEPVVDVYEDDDYGNYLESNEVDGVVGRCLENLKVRG